MSETCIAIPITILSEFNVPPSIVDIQAKLRTLPKHLRCHDVNIDTVTIAHDGKLERYSFFGSINLEPFKTDSQTFQDLKSHLWLAEGYVWFESDVVEENFLSEPCFKDRMMIMPRRTISR